MFVIFDVEASSMDLQTSQIIEIAGVKLDEDLEPIDHYSSLVTCDSALPKSIIELTGISDTMLAAEGNALGTVIDEFGRFISGEILVAHNALYDMSQLYKVDSTRREFYCTLYMSRLLIPWSPKHGLAAICEELGIRLTDHHRAFSDVMGAASLFQVLYPMMVARSCDWRNHIHVRENESQPSFPGFVAETYQKGRTSRFFFSEKAEK